MSRQSLFPRIFVAVTILATSATAWAEPAGQSYTLRSRWTPGTIDRVKSTLEVNGDLVVTEANQLKRLKTSVMANLGYHERLLTAPSKTGSPARSVRHYEDASANIKVEKDGFKPALSEGRRLIGVEIDGNSATLFSPNGLLTREELDLIDVQGNSLLFDRLLPDKPVTVGETWNLSDELLTLLLRLDQVSKTEVVAKLVSVANGGAIVEYSGKVEGAINGVSTTVELKGKYRFNMPAGRIDWAALLIREDRSIGHVGTGLNVVARLQTTITPGVTFDRLSDAALRDLPLEPTAELTPLVQKAGNGQWQFTYDRRWFVTADQQDHLILRLVDRGELVAQCNIAGLAQVSPEKLVTLTGFQQDIQQALGKNFGQFINATQQANQANYRVYRVVVEGEVEKLPIQWLYHLVADQDGHQVSFAFTIEASLMDQFGQADEPLVQSLRFIHNDVALRVKPVPTSAQLRVLVR